MLPLSIIEILLSFQVWWPLRVLYCRMLSLGLCHLLVDSVQTKLLSSFVLEFWPKTALNMRRTYSRGKK